MEKAWRAVVRGCRGLDQGRRETGDEALFDAVLVGIQEARAGRAGKACVGGSELRLVRDVAAAHGRPILRHGLGLLLAAVLSGDADAQSRALAAGAARHFDGGWVVVCGLAEDVSAEEVEVLGELLGEMAAATERREASRREEKLLAASVKDRDLLLEIRRAPDPARDVIGVRMATDLQRRLEARDAAAREREEEKEAAARKAAMYVPRAAKRRTHVAHDLWRGPCTLSNAEDGICIETVASLSAELFYAVQEDTAEEDGGAQFSWGLVDGQAAAPDNYYDFDGDGAPPLRKALAVLRVRARTEGGPRKKALVFDAVVSRAAAKAFFEKMSEEEDDDDDDDDSDDGRGGPVSRAATRGVDDAEGAPPPPPPPREVRGVLGLKQLPKLAKKMCEALVVVPRGALRAQRYGGGFFGLINNQTPPPSGGEAPPLRATAVWGYAESEDGEKAHYAVVSKCARILGGVFTPQAERAALLVAVGEINAAIITSVPTDANNAVLVSGGLPLPRPQSKSAIDADARRDLVECRDHIVEALKKQTLIGLKRQLSKHTKKYAGQQQQQQQQQQHELSSPRACSSSKGALAVVTVKSLTELLVTVAPRDAPEDDDAAAVEAKRVAEEKKEAEADFLQPRVVLGETTDGDTFVIPAEAGGVSPRKGAYSETYSASRASTTHSRASRAIFRAEVLARQEIDLKQRKQAARTASSTLSNWRQRVNKRTEVEQRECLERALHIEEAYVAKRHDDLLERPKVRPFKV